MEERPRTRDREASSKQEGGIPEELAALIAAEKGQARVKEGHIARYGRPMVLKPKVVTWGARMGVGPAFVKGNALRMRGYWFVNYDLADPLTVVGRKEDDIVLGTGAVSRPGQEGPTDLRILTVRTVAEAVEMTKSDDVVERATGAWALGELGIKEAIPWLKQLLDDEEWLVQRYALQSIRLLAAPDDAAEAALRAMGNDDGLVVEAAIAILRQRRGDPRAVAALLEHVEDEAWTVARAAIEALGSMGDKTALPRLEKALEKDPILTKQALAQAIDKLRSSDAKQ